MKRAFVTGADRGLGVSFTKQLLEENWMVFAGQYMKNWHELDELKKQFPDSLILVPLDISKDSSVDEALEIVKSYTDGLELVINNAAVMPSTYIRDAEVINDRTGDENIFIRPDTDLFSKIYNINSLGPLRVTNRFIELLIRGEGDKTLLNISSEAGSMTDQWCERDYQIGYCMTKAALNMQSVIVQNCLKPYGVKVIIADPGGLKSYILLGTRREGEGLIEPEDSARGILKIVKEHRQIDVNDMYFKFDGRKLTW